MRLVPKTKKPGKNRVPGLGLKVNRGISPFAMRRNKIINRVKARQPGKYGIFFSLINNAA